MPTHSISHTTIAGFPAIRIEGRADRPPLLFVHGAFVTHEPFAPWMEYFARADWRSIAAARRGRLGVGPRQAEGMGFAEYLEDTRRVIDALGELPIVVGHSSGGLLAQKLAELGLCTGLVLLAPAPAKMLPAQPAAIPGYLKMLPKILAGAPVMPTCTTCSTITLNCIPPEQHDAIHARLVHESGKAYREMIFGRIRVEAAKVRVPVLVVNGAEDRIISPALARWTAKRYGGELKLFENHAHWLLEEPGWQAIAGEIAAWLHTRFLAMQPVPLAGAA